MNPSFSNAISLLVAALATLMLLWFLLRRADALPVDRPNERSLHQRPTPRIGGMAMFPGIVLACIAAGARDSSVLVPMGLSMVPDDE